ncbi:hypothetical protein N7478_007562 [Penicillium angulare]|uniref:uncharacterized protein n=1 Tax=Penicillium angulare TaxID=116970 RepID=UPI002541CC5C|nr:uncharacterized protein N7478_007562 [Penicillium angulare]KAJ5272437.1 hypothetical protein N7478_007562 [Penicillium angulare]
MSMCYQLTVSKNATQYPYLLHAALAMAALQDGSSQLLTGATCSEGSRQQYHYHSQCAAALFNERLSKPASKAVDRNAIWTTASLLGNMTSFLMESCDPEMSWPLSSSSAYPFDWLDMHIGMRTLYSLCAPNEPGGLFHSLLQHPTYNVLRDKWIADTRDGIEGIPSQFVTLCGLTPMSNAQNSPYHASVRLLAQIWDMESTPHTAFRFLTFISLMSPEMKTLLVQKDTRAMVILAYWYSKMFHVHYWLHRRAVVGCAAICIYLKRHHCSDYLIMDMLQYPLSKLGEFDAGIPALKQLTDAELSPGTSIWTNDSGTEEYLYPSNWDPWLFSEGTNSILEIAEI